MSSFPHLWSLPFAALNILLGQFAPYSRITANPTSTAMCEPLGVECGTGAVVKKLKKKICSSTVLSAKYMSNLVPISPSSNATLFTLCYVPTTYDYFLENMLGMFFITKKSVPD